MHSSLLTVMLVLSASSASQPPSPPAPCGAPDYRQLDFWVGDWDIEFDAGQGKLGHATNHIRSDEFGSCVVSEHFELPATQYKGASYSMYDPATKLWHQMWVDNQGTPFELEGGPVTGKPYPFELRTTRPVGNPKSLHRMIWENVSTHALTWRWQSLKADGTWVDAWVLRYRRQPAKGR